MDKRIQDIYKRAGFNTDEEKQDEPIKYEDGKKLCSKCKERKSLYSFGTTDNKEYKSICISCETLLNKPKEQAEIVSENKGKPMITFPKDKNDKQSNKKMTKRITNPKVRKLNKTMKDNVETRERLEKEANEFYQEVIIPYVKKNHDGVTTTDIRLYLKMDKFQWVDAKLRKLCELGLLNKRRTKHGEPFKYFIVNAKDIGIRTMEDGGQQADIEIIDDPIKEPLTSERERIENDKIKRAKIEEEKQKLISKPIDEVMDNFDKNLKEEKTQKEKFNEIKLIEIDQPIDPTMEPEEDFISKISKIADSINIDFIKKTTTIIVSPTHNILRAYDILTDDQKEKSDIKYLNGNKVLVFSW